MSATKANKKMPIVAVELPECPVCMDTMTAPIFQCQSGHSICSSCSKVLMPPICPICRQPMTQMRNWQLEAMISKAKVPCPNKSIGCVYTMTNDDLDDHLKECIFRQMDCPLGAVFGRCSWQGKLKEIMDHFKERHQENCNVTSDADVELTNVTLKEDNRYVYLTSQGKILFIITVKIDTLQNTAYWTIQLIGGKNVARQHIYEIHVNSKQDPRRKTVFIEHCFNDAIKADEVFRMAKCGVMPLNLLSHYVKDKKMSFRFFIKRMPLMPKNNSNMDDGKNDNKPPNKGPKGPKPGGAAGPKPKGPGPKKPFKANA